MRPQLRFMASALAALAMSAPAMAATESFVAQWKSLDQAVVVDATFTVDLDNFVFLIGTDWWYSAASLLDLSVTVSGSSLPAANGAFPQSHFDWLLLGSVTAQTPADAVLAPDVNLSLGANGSGGLLGPSAAGNTGTMQVGSGGAGGQEFVYFRTLTPVAPVPEPAGAAMAIAGLGLLGLALRRQQRPRPAQA